MKRIWIAICLAFLAVAGVAQDQQPSVADAARAARTQKKAQPKMVFDNDTLPRSGELSVVGTASAKPKSDAKDSKSGKPDANKDAADALTKAIADKKKDISDLSKEIDLLQREHKVKQTLGYVDVGNRLRDPKKWDDDEKKYQADLADRQNKLADAQKQLIDLEAQAKALTSAQ